MLLLLLFFSSFICVYVFCSIRHLFHLKTKNQTLFFTHISHKNFRHIFTLEINNHSHKSERNIKILYHSFIWVTSLFPSFILYVSSFCTVFVCATNNCLVIKWRFNTDWLLWMESSVFVVQMIQRICNVILVFIVDLTFRCRELKKPKNTNIWTQLFLLRIHQMAVYSVSRSFSTVE